MANSSNFRTAPCGALMEYNELIFCDLYLHHPNSDKDGEKHTIIHVNGVSGFGATAVNNWEIYDGAGYDATVVARGQGLHISAGNWHNTFSMVFDADRFMGSTLQVMGISIEDGEWAIVGGTGEFAMATGVIFKKIREKSEQYKIIELTIRAFCPLLKGSWSLPTKIGPWGGDGGTAQNIIKASRRLESITISSGDVVDSIAFSYIDEADQKCTTDRLGGPGGSPSMIQLAPSEFVTEVSGTISDGHYEVVESLQFVTNIQTYGPFGTEDGTPFTFSVPRYKKVVGFFGRGGSYLDAIGIYLQPI